MAQEATQFAHTCATMSSVSLMGQPKVGKSTSLKYNVYIEDRIDSCSTREIKAM